MLQFPASPITALIDESPDVNLSESIGPDLSLADIGDPASLAGLSLGYGTSAGDPQRMSAASTTGWPSGGRRSLRVRGSATAPT